MSVSGPVLRRAMPGTQRHGRNGCWWCAPSCMQPNRPRVGKTSVPGGDKTRGPHAPQRAGETANHRRSDAHGGHCPRAQGASGGGVAQRDMDKQVEQTTHYVGRGARLCAPREAGGPETRYHLTHIARQADTIAARSQRFGWTAFVTNAGPKRLSWREAVLGYRNEYRVERIFHRLKSRLHIAPLFVKLNEHIEGLTSLLTARGPGAHGHGVCPATVS